MVELLKEGQYAPRTVTQEVMIVWMGTNGHLDHLPNDAIARFEQEFFAFCSEKYPDLEHTLSKELKISDELKAKLKDAAEKFKEVFSA